MALIFRLSSKAGSTEAAAKDMEAAAAEGAGGNKETRGGGTTQTGGRDPQNPRPFQPGRAVQPLYETGGGKDEDTQQSKTTSASFLFKSDADELGMGLQD